MDLEEDIVVSICCLSYNHASYIHKCMEGLLMQKASFRYEIIIHDDCSTDGTIDIIKEYANKYPDLVYPIIQSSNQYKKTDRGILPTFLLPKTRGKYIAICECDDFWIDPLKLQKQVEQLEAHPNFMMVYTDYYTVDQQGYSIYRKEYEGILKPSSKTGDILPSLFIKNFPMTLTTMYRKEVFLSPVLKNAPLGIDYLYCMTAAFMGDCCYIPDKTACYRKSPDGMMNSQLERVVAKINVLNKYFALEYVKGHSKKETFRNHYSIMQTICLRFMDDKEVMEQLVEANGNVRFWKTIFGMKRSLHRLLK